MDSNTSISKQADRLSGSAGRVKRQLAFGVAVAVSVLAFSGSFVGGTTQAAEGLDERSVQFRTEFGLDLSSANFAEASARPNSTAEYGVPLTQAEVDDLEARRLREPLIADLQTALLGVPNFGGLYIDQTRGGLVQASFVGDLPQAESSVNDLVPDGVTIEFRSVLYTEAQLVDGVGAVTKDTDYQASLGVSVLEVYPDIKTNRTQVGIFPYSARAAASMGERYGDIVSVYAAQPQHPTACTNRANCPGPPLQAGIQLYDPGCTTGFIGRKNSTTDYVLLTAGHCANLVPAGHVYQHPNNVNIGTMGVEVFYSGSNADAGWIQMSDSLKSNRVYLSPTSYFPINGRQTQAQEVIGMTVCASGRITGYACGTLVAKGFSITLSGTLLHNQRAGSYPLQSGDSGGPIFAFNKAFGIQSGINTAGNGIYSHVTYVESMLNVVVNTSP